MLMPRLPAAPMQLAALTNQSPAGNLPFTNLFCRFTNDWPHLTDSQVAAYLKANRTNAATLLAAYRTSHDRALLKEAMKQFPDSPQVTFEAATAYGLDLSPAEKREWLNAFKKSAPDNALANYLSANNYFNSGQIEQGIQELTESQGKGFSDYAVERTQDDGEAYLSAGYSVAEATFISSSGLTLSQLTDMKLLAKNLVDLGNAYRQAGDQVSAQATFQMALSVGQILDNRSTPCLINLLVGLAIQKNVLGAMDPNSPYGDNGQTVQDQLNQIKETRKDMRELTAQADALLNTLSDQDVLNYLNRRNSFGEVAALKWVVGKFGPQ